MLYFKTVPFPIGFKQPDVEKALRSYALKRTSSLDFKSSTINIGIDKFFLGLEGKTSLTFTRLRTSFEVLLPKIIINLPKDPAATAYRIRLSAIPSALCILMLFGVLSILIGLITGKAKVEGVIFMLVAVTIFIVLLNLEVKLLQSKVLKSIKMADDSALKVKGTV